MKTNRIAGLGAAMFLAAWMAAGRGGRTRNRIRKLQLHPLRSSNGNSSSGPGSRRSRSLNCHGKLRLQGRSSRAVDRLPKRNHLSHITKRAWAASSSTTPRRPPLT